MENSPESKEWTATATAVGTRVWQERELRNLTKEALAERCGLASRYIWRVEEGRQNLVLFTLAKIAQGLDMTLAELLQGVEELIRNPIPKPETKPRGPTARRKAGAAQPSAKD